eukprot:3490478-Pleurochrysis_carterae.AAC.2
MQFPPDGLARWLAVALPIARATRTCDKEASAAGDCSRRANTPRTNRRRVNKRWEAVGGRSARASARAGRRVYARVRVRARARIGVTGVSVSRRLSSSPPRPSWPQSPLPTMSTPPLSSPRSCSAEERSRFARGPERQARTARTRPARE